MTGGDGPTTLPGKTTTSPYGRDVKSAGYPIRMSEMLSTLVAPNTLLELQTPRLMFKKPNGQSKKPSKSKLTTTVLL